MSHHRFVVLQHDDRGGILGELPPSSFFSKRPYHPLNQAQKIECRICGDEITTESTQRGLPRTRCDFCKKEKNRLRNMMRYWFDKVGIRFDIEEDFEDDPEDDTNEFH